MDDINDSDSKDVSEMNFDDEDEIKDTVNDKLVEEPKKAAPIPRITSARPQPLPKVEPVKRAEPTVPIKSPSKPDILKDSTYSADLKGILNSDFRFRVR